MTARSSRGSICLMPKCWKVENWLHKDELPSRRRQVNLMNRRFWCCVMSIESIIERKPQRNTQLFECETSNFTFSFFFFSETFKRMIEYIPSEFSIFAGLDSKLTTPTGLWWFFGRCFIFFHRHISTLSAVCVLSDEKRVRRVSLKLIYLNCSFFFLLFSYRHRTLTMTREQSDTRTWSARGEKCKIAVRERREWERERRSAWKNA